jgi:hypothetical protein
MRLTNFERLVFLEESVDHHNTFQELTSDDVIVAREISSCYGFSLEEIFKISSQMGDLNLQREEELDLLLDELEMLLLLKVS